MTDHDAMPGPPDGAGYTVLVAEDRPAVTLMVRTLLVRWGFTVMTARCDASALRLLADARIDLVIIGATAAGAALVAEACAGMGGEPAPFVALVTQGHHLPAARAQVALPVSAPALRAAVWQCLAADAGPIDTAAISTLWGSTTNPVFHRIVRVFIPEARHQLRRIQDLVSAGDWSATEVEAHALKGAAANVAAHAIRDVAARIETLAERGDRLSIPPLLETLRIVTEQGIMALERIAAAGAGVA